MAESIVGREAERAVLDSVLRFASKEDRRALDGLVLMMSPLGLVENAWSRDLVERVVTIDRLM